MAKKRTGVFGAMGNLIRWTIWGLAAVLVLAIVLNFTREDDAVVASNDGDQPVEEVLEAADTDEVVSDAVEEQLEEATNTEIADTAAEVVEDADDAAAAAENAAAEAEDELEEAIDELETAAENAGEAAETALAEAEDTVRDALNEVTEATSGAETAAEAALDEANAALEDATSGDQPIEDALEAGDADELVSDAVEEQLEEAANTELTDAESAAENAEEAAATEGAVSDEDADLNILPTDLETFQVPGDAATYNLLSVFQRDDGTIEVVTDRTADGVTTQTTRLVTCAPFAVGTVQEGDGPRNDAPELERIPLGSAAATIAALACGIMN